MIEYESVKDNLIKYKCLSCNKDYSNKIDEELKRWFKNTFKFSNCDVSKSIVLLRKGFYPYEYMDDWKNFNKTSLPEKEEFYSILNVKNITDAGYMHAKRVCKDFEIKNVGDCHDDLCLKSDTLLLADVFKNVRKMGFKMYHLYSINIISTTALAWKAILKKTEVK